MLVVVYAVLLENFWMKRIFVLLVFALFTQLSYGQKDTSFLGRLNAVLRFTRLKDIDKVMDYTYPKLFTIVPREQLVEAMKGSYETDDFITELDSVNIIKVFPVFKINDGSYAKVKHSLLMKMKYKEPLDTSDKEGNNEMIKSMEEQFGKGNVRFDIAANSLNIFMIADLVAIKDQFSANWTFVNLDEDNPAMLDMLFSKEVIAKLKEFK